MNRMSWLIVAALVLLLALWVLSSQNPSEIETPVASPVVEAPAPTIAEIAPDAPIEPAVTQARTPDDFIKDGLVTAQDVQALIENYFLSEKAWPNSNEVLDIRPADQMVSDALQRIEVRSGGTVVLTYSAASGKDGAEIVLKPTFDSNAQRISWACTSSGFSQIAKLSPACEYTGI